MKYGKNMKENEGEKQLSLSHVMDTKEGKVFCPNGQKETIQQNQ